MARHAAAAPGGRAPRPTGRAPRKAAGGRAAKRPAAAGAADATPPPPKPVAGLAAKDATASPSRARATAARTGRTDGRKAAEALAGKAAPAPPPPTPAKPGVLGRVVRALRHVFGGDSAAADDPPAPTPVAPAGMAMSDGDDAEGAEDAVPLDSDGSLDSDLEDRLLSAIYHTSNVADTLALAGAETAPPLVRGAVVDAVAEEQAAKAGRAPGALAPPAAAAAVPPSPPRPPCAAQAASALELPFQLAFDAAAPAPPAAPTPAEAGRGAVSPARGPPAPAPGQSALGLDQVIHVRVRGATHPGGWVGAGAQGISLALPWAWATADSQPLLYRADGHLLQLRPGRAPGVALPRGARTGGPPKIGKAASALGATHMARPFEAGLRARGPQKPTPCHLCGQTTHLRANCPESLCFACHRPGHQLRVRITPARPPTPGGTWLIPQTPGCRCPRPQDCKNRYRRTNEPCHRCRQPGHPAKVGRRAGGDASVPRYGVLTADGVHEAHPAPLRCRCARASGACTTTCRPRSGPTRRRSCARRATSAARATTLATYVRALPWQVCAAAHPPYRACRWRVGCAHGWQDCWKRSRPMLTAFHGSDGGGALSAPVAKANGRHHRFASSDDDAAERRPGRSPAKSTVAAAAPPPAEAGSDAGSESGGYASASDASDDEDDVQLSWQTASRVGGSQDDFYDDGDYVSDYSDDEY